MPKTMKAAVVRALGQPLSIEEVPVPTPGVGEVLVKIMASGVCHTDLHAAEGDWPVKPMPPFIPGHEGAGVVVAVGPGVTELKEGDPVGIAWLHDACGVCESCITGWETLCPSQHNSGYGVNGCFRRICDRECRLRRPSAGEGRLRRTGAHPLRRRDHLQGHQGDRSETWRMARHFRDRRTRPRCRAVRESNGSARRCDRRRRRQARSWPARLAQMSP